MRTVTVDLYVNDGLNNVAPGRSITGLMVSLGSISWDIDEQITIATPGSLSIKVADHAGTLWEWIKTSVPTTLGGASQLFPPWVVVNVDGSAVFLGMLDLASVRRNENTAEVELSAQDHSVMLKDVRLEGAKWERPGPLVTGSGSATDYTGYPPWSPYAPGGQILIYGGDYTQTFFPGATIQANHTGPVWQVLLSSYEASTSITYLTVGGVGTTPFWQTLGYPASAVITRLATTVIPQVSYFVTSAITATQQAPVYEIPVNSVDGLVPGDTMARQGKGVVHVDDVDGERKLIISATPITDSFLLNEQLTLSSDSKKELVNWSALDILRAALSPLTLDTSVFVQPTISTPAFTFLSLVNPSMGNALRSLHDLEPSLTGIRAFGDGSIWSGTLAAGYTESTGVAPRYVDWTQQTTTPPARLVPDLSVGVVPRARMRNRGYSVWKAHYPQMVDNAWVPLVTPIDTPVATAWPSLVHCTDYAAFRSILLNNADGIWREQTWDGSAWSTLTAFTKGTTTGGPWYAYAACPFVTTAASVGPTPLGKTLLVLVGDASGNFQLQLHFAGAAAAQLSVSAAIAKNAILVPTPWGAYIVGPGGYGRVTYSAGTLTLTWGQIFDGSTCWLQPNTFCAIDSGSCWILARLDWKNPEKPEERGSETRLFNLAATPSDPAALILNGTDNTGVRVMPLPPRICRMFRNPEDQTTLVGILGSRLFQVAPKLPTTLERIRVQGLTAAELLEHTCQAINAIAIPRPDGSIRLVGRSDAGTATPITVDKVSETQNRISPFFFSAVRVSAADDSIYADAYGLWKGGKTLEISHHPMISHEAQCFAVAASYATFTGKPRRLSEQKWFHYNADTPPVWELLRPWQKLTINGGSESWLLKGLTYDIIKGTADAKLLEA